MRTRWNYLAGAIDVCAHELMHGVTEYQPPGSGPLKADYLVAGDVVTPVTAGQAEAAERIGPG